MIDRLHYPAIGGSEEELVNLIHRDRWTAQDSFVRPHTKQVEENIRMVSGRHWDVWVEAMGKFVDVARWMTESERQWRQRPVFNWVGYWYTITHAKFVENPPVITFLPATADRNDMILAEIFDPVYKYLWDVIGMSDKVDDLVRWIVSAGSCTLKTYWDPDAGETVPLVMPEFPVPMGNGQDLIVQNAPFQLDRSGDLVPQFEVGPDGSVIQTGEPGMIPKGQINVDVLSPLEVRSSPEPVPFREKRWHVQRSVMHVDEIMDVYGVQVEPDIEEGQDNVLNKLLFGSGDIGASDKQLGKSGDLKKRTEGFSAVYELWEMPRSEIPEGRFAVVTKSKRLTDGPNPEAPRFRPFRQFDFIKLPGRPWGKSPVEDMAPIQRTYNRGWAQILEHRNLMTNPLWIKDSLSGIKNIKNQPGSVVTALRRPGVHALEAVQPPQLPPVVYEIQQMLKSEMQDIGSLRGGSEGRAPTRDASGELVKELRFNDDRFIGPAARRIVDNIAGLVEEWQILLRNHWDEDTTIRVSGEQNAARFIMVKKEMFKGRVNVKGVAESMLPEGRGERQQRLDFWLSAGLLTPNQYFDLYNHPHLGAATKPGGVHRQMAEFEHKVLMQGQIIAPIDPHDDEIHLAIHEEFMASPEFMQIDPQIQQLFAIHVEMHKEIVMQKVMEDLERQAIAGQVASATEVQASAPMRAAIAADAATEEP